MSDNNQTSNKNVYLSIIFVLLMVNIIGIYYMWKNHKTEAVVQEQSSEIIELEDELSAMQIDFNNQLAELNTLKGQNAELDSVLAVREHTIQLHLEELDRWKKKSKVSKSELQSLRDQITEYEAEREKFIAEINDLFEQNKVLTEEKSQLESQLGEEVKENNELQVTTAYLSNKFELGSILEADELSAMGVKVKKNGAEKEVHKVSQTNKIVVCYQTGVNNVREAGTVSMQLRLLNPKGETMYQEQEGSGSFVSKTNNEQLRYSKQATFEYDNTNKKICLDWSKNITEPGNYTAEIYQDGYLVGKKSFELK